MGATYVSRGVLNLFFYETPGKSKADVRVFMQKTGASVL